MCKKEIEKQDIKLQATYKAMFRGSSKPASSDNVNTVSGNTNHLSSGDSPSNGISDINGTSWSIVQINDYHKRYLVLAIYLFGTIPFSISVKKTEPCISKCCSSQRCFFGTVLVQSCNLQKNCLMLLWSLKKKKKRRKRSKQAWISMSFYS